jgi:hypothetical protein
MNSLEEVVVNPVVKQKKTRKPKKAEPVVEEIKPEPEPKPVSLPVVAEPEPEPAVCEVCGDELPPPFSDAEMDVYRRINAYKRKLLRLKKVACLTAEV